MLKNMLNIKNLKFNHKRLKLDVGLNKYWRKSFKEFRITPTLYFIWDTQFEKDYEDFKGSKELMIGIDWLWLGVWFSLEIENK